MRIFKFLLERSPYLEISIRHVYWILRRRFGFFDRNLSSFPARTPTAAGQIEFSEVAEILRSEGVREGSLLLVHSSALALSSTGLNEKQIIIALRELVGESGTLAMPAIPRCDGQPTGAEFIFGDTSGLTLTYDPKRTVPWTGLLPFLLMKQPGAIRSSHPINSMVAWGPAAEKMMRMELVGELPLPCGPFSPWYFCAENDAVIVGLGVDMAQALTIIHVNEDAFVEQWPFRNWYRSRTFDLVSADGARKLQVRERLPRFALNYCGFKLARDLRCAGLLNEHQIGNITISVIHSCKLMSFLAERRATGYPFYFFPWQKNVAGFR